MGDKIDEAFGGWWRGVEPPSEGDVPTTTYFRIQVAFRAGYLRAVEDQKPSVEISVDGVRWRPMKLGETTDE